MFFSGGSRQSLRPAPPNARIHLLAFFCLLALSLNGCSGRLPPAAPLQELHAPGLVRLDAFARLQASTGNLQVRSLVAYNTAGTPGATHLLILAGLLYDVTLDGSAPIRAIQGPTCDLLGGVDETSGQVLCEKVVPSGVIAFHPDTATTTWLGRPLVAGVTWEDQYGYPAWRPDGRDFAAVHTHVHQQDIAQGADRTHSSQQDNSQDIAIFAVDGALTNVQHVATLALPPQPSFVIHWLSWSPDGKWLAFAGGSGNLSTTYGIRIASLLPQRPQSGGDPLLVTLHPDQVIKLLNQFVTGQAWQPTGDNLAYMDGERLTEMNVATGQSRTLLTIPDGYLCGLTWTPDGKRLIFAQCRGAPVESSPPLAQIYIYTLP